MKHKNQLGIFHFDVTRSTPLFCLYTTHTTAWTGWATIDQLCNLSRFSALDTSHIYSVKTKDAAGPGVPARVQAGRRSS